MTEVHRSRIFTASCVALIVTAMTFAIRAGILTQLGEDFQLNNTQLGWINGVAFLGFPVAMMFGGLIYNFLGPKKLLAIAFICHAIGLVMTMTATGFWTLILSSFFIGFANGSVEAACNPLIAELYHDKKTVMLNKFHVWFPGGIVIGSLTSLLMGDVLGLGWQWQIGIMLLPTAIYGYLVFVEAFPSLDHTETSTLNNVKALASPLFIFMMICMTVTAISEFGPQQWVEKTLGSSGVHPMVILAMVTGLMAVGRYFAGPVVEALNPAGVLLASSVVATIGVYTMSFATGPMIYVAAILFALGVMYFWPTMIGFVSEYLPKTGALGMSLMGGAGMFSVSIWNPIIGGWLDSAKADALAAGKVGAEADLAAGVATLESMALFPAALIVAFTFLFIIRKKLVRGEIKAEPLAD
ncbi:sugar MFS transporter [Gilvimarinus sp. DA14]|uniref:MFS transporter n=1 Tax=Gilvimarinus sp. DA14 TaxID=2956798 RepID=UPI0020B80C15|nr:MFS transporter [Gilvimarinus sp. DA14]UTF60260.1 MFS transporter [Gilvimarinus sp. DA14]